MTHYEGASATWKPRPPYSMLAPLQDLGTFTAPPLEGFDTSVPASRGIKGPRGLDSRKTADPDMQSKRKSKFCLSPGTSWKRMPRSLSLETSATSPSDGYSFLICTVESHPICLERHRGSRIGWKASTPPGFLGTHPHLAASSRGALAVERR